MKIICQPIDMISWTEKDGTIHPIKFQLEDYNDQKHTYKIQKIQRVDKDKLAGNLMLKYTCEISLNNRARLCEIRYERDTMKWFLYKI